MEKLLLIIPSNGPNIIPRRIRIGIYAIVNFPESVIAKSPSAGLWEGQRDEDELGMKYEEIDAAVEKLVKQKKPPSNQWERRVSDMIRTSEHKRRPPESML